MPLPQRAKGIRPSYICLYSRFLRSSLQLTRRCNVYPIPALVVRNSDVASANLTERVVASVPELVGERKLFVFRRKPRKPFFLLDLLVSSVFGDANILTLLPPCAKRINTTGLQNLDRELDSTQLVLPHPFFFGGRGGGAAQFKKKIGTNNTNRKIRTPC